MRRLLAFRTIFVALGMVVGLPELCSALCMHGHLHCSHCGYSYTYRSYGTTGPMVMAVPGMVMAAPGMVAVGPPAAAPGLTPTTPITPTTPSGSNNAPGPATAPGPVAFLPSPVAAPAGSPAPAYPYAYSAYPYSAFPGSPAPVAAPTPFPAAASPFPAAAGLLPSLLPRLDLLDLKALRVPPNTPMPPQLFASHLLQMLQDTFGTAPNPNLTRQVVIDQALMFVKKSLPILSNVAIESLPLSPTDKQVLEKLADSILESQNGPKVPDVPTPPRQPGETVPETPTVDQTKVVADPDSNTIDVTFRIKLPPSLKIGPK